MYLVSVASFSPRRHALLSQQTHSALNGCCQGNQGKSFISKDSWQIVCSKWYHSKSTVPCWRDGLAVTYHSPDRPTGVLCSQVFKISTLCHLSQRHQKIRAHLGTGSSEKGTYYFLPSSLRPTVNNPARKQDSKELQPLHLQTTAAHRSWKYCWTRASVLPRTFVVAGNYALQLLEKTALLLYQLADWISNKDEAQALLHLSVYK